MITEEEIRGWFAGRLPEDIFDGAPEVTTDREEIVVVGRIAAPATAASASAAERDAAAEGRIQEFRERTREQRIAIALYAEQTFGRKVAWGAECDGVTALFTHVAAPVMTRLRQPERQVLDTLVGAGVARSRSDALAWCVKLVRHHSDEWLSDLRNSLEQVQRVRAQGPDIGPRGTPTEHRTEDEGKRP